MAFIRKWAVIGGLLLGLLYFTGYVGGPVGGEVVSLRTFDARGIGSDTSLWIVDVDGKQYLRSGRSGSDWLGRLIAQPRVQMTRNGETHDYDAVIVPTRREFVNGRIAEKYGVAAIVIGWAIDPAETVPVRLDRASD